MRRVTLKDLARATGVSVSTVSLALRGDERISQETTARVQVAADRLGYRGDFAGSLLRVGNPRILGLVARLDQELHSRYHERILVEAKEHGWQVIVVPTSPSRDVADAVSFLATCRARAVVLIDPPGGAVPRDCPGPVVIAQAGPDFCDLVTSDCAPGLAQLGAALSRAGRRRWLYLDGPEGTSAGVRRSGVLAAARGVGADVVVRPAGATFDDGYAALLEPAEAGCDAVVAYNDHCAHGAMVALWRRGRQIPGDVAVAGVDNIASSRGQAWRLTSVDRNVEEVAAQAFRIAVRRADEPDAPLSRVRIATRLRERSSTLGAAGGT